MALASALHKIKVADHVLTAYAINVAGNILANMIDTEIKQMKRVLVIKAHPFDATRSRSVHILDVFMEAYRVANPEDQIQTLDLFAPEFPALDGAMITAWGQVAAGTAFTDLPEATQRALGQFDNALAQFKAADKIVIANPMWNLSIPAQLKSWVDAITVVQETFRYTATGHVALVPGKKVVHIQAAGGRYDGKDDGTQYVYDAMTYLGVDEVTKIAVEGMDHFPDQAQEIVTAAEEQAKKVAAKF